MPLVNVTPFRAPPPASCTSYHGPAFWTPAGGITWNGTSWVLPDNGSSQLNVTGTWANGFRPTSVDLTYTLSPGFLSDFHDFVFDDTTNAALGSVSGSGNGLGTFVLSTPLTFGANDIGRIDIDSFGYFGSTTIDDVCFYS